MSNIQIIANNQFEDADLLSLLFTSRWKFLLEQDVEYPYHYVKYIDYVPERREMLREIVLSFKKKN